MALYRVLTEQDELAQAPSEGRELFERMLAKAELVEVDEPALAL